MTDYKNLRKLTLVMLSFERQLFVIRSMKYWSNKNVKLVVLDGSKRAIKSSFLKSLNLNRNIYYEHYKSSYVKRLKRATSLVNTKYVALIGDDEFYIPSTVEKCINELDKNNELVSCIGRAVGFWPMDGAVYGRSKYPELLDYKILHNEPKERIKFHMRNYVPSLVYGVTRSFQWKIATSAIIEKEFTVFAIFELQMEMILSFCGKSKVIPFLMWLRSSKESKKKIHKEKSLNPKNKFPEWWQNKQLKNEHKRFISIVSEKFSLLNPGHKYEYYKNSVIDACNSYNDYCFERKLKRKVSLARKLVRLFTRFIHDERKRKIKNFFIGFISMPKLYNNLLLDEVTAMKKKNVTVDLKEMKKIIRIIMNFHNNKISE